MAAPPRQSLATAPSHKAPTVQVSRSHLYSTRPGFLPLSESCSKTPPRTGIRPIWKCAIAAFGVVCLIWRWAGIRPGFPTESDAPRGIHQGRVSPSPNDDYDYCEAGLPPLDWPNNFTATHHLSQVHLLVRHGDRSPVTVLPNNNNNIPWNSCTSDEFRTYSDSSRGTGPLFRKDGGVPASGASVGPMHGWSGNCYLGQLTARGYKQHVQLGERLRERYVSKLGFLPWSSLWAGETFYIRSTDVPRTVQSANGIMLGLYPHSKFFHPADSIHVHPRHLESMIPSNLMSNCHRLKHYYDTVIPASPEVKRFAEQVQEEVKEVRAILGLPKESNPRPGHGELLPFRAEDPIRARLCWNMPMPCSATNGTWCLSREQGMDVFGWASWQQAFNHGQFADSKSLNRLTMGAFFKEWLTNIEESKHKFYIYAAHDSTLLAFLGALEAKDLRWPPYRSNILFEIWSGNEDPSERLVRAIYNGRVLSTHWCDFEACDYKDFIRHLESYVPDYDHECSVDEHL